MFAEFNLSSIKKKVLLILPQGPCTAATSGF
jgi:hypothetical protein